MKNIFESRLCQFILLTYQPNQVKQNRTQLQKPKKCKKDEAEVDNIIIIINKSKN